MNKFEFLKIYNSPFLRPKVKFYIGGPSTNLRVNRFYNCHNITSIYNPHNNNNNQDIDDNRPVKPKPVDRGQHSNL